MRSFPVEELVDRIGNRYALVVAVAKRARQIKEGAKPFVELQTNNPTTIALHEIAAGYVQLAEATEEEPERVKKPAEEVAELLGTTLDEMEEEADDEADDEDESEEDEDDEDDDKDDEDE
ncbi:MAG: DNA-directed RNA polymerase subunit omega [Armatimonadota bacterium]